MCNADPHLSLADFRPVSRLEVARSEIAAPRRPVIDAHNHLGASFGGGWDQRPVAELIDRLDKAQIETYVDLDGGWGEAILDAHLKHFKEQAPERFVHFGGVAWHLWAEEGDRFGERAAKRFRDQVARGAEGLKVWKDFGLKVRDEKGALVAVDDGRLDPLWETVAELDVPVTIHIADPVAFFDPLDETNERWEELRAHPDWHFPNPPYPPFDAVIGAFARLVERHPDVTFIGAHVACYAENLAWVGALLDRCPNLHLDISARISELGRQPYTARRFFKTYADRILFGIDCGPELNVYRIYYRFLETADEYFSYGADAVPSQGRWQIYGLDLPAEVLDKVYFGNAARLLKRASLTKQEEQVRTCYGTRKFL